MRPRGKPGYTQGILLGVVWGGSAALWQGIWLEGEGILRCGIVKALCLSLFFYVLKLCTYVTSLRRWGISANNEFVANE